MTAFTDEEEREMQLDQYMPFFLETKLREKGANFITAFPLLSFFKKLPKPQQLFLPYFYSIVDFAP